MNDASTFDLRTPVLTWLERRAAQLGVTGFDWAGNDPLGKHLLPGLYWLAKHGQAQISAETHRLAANVYLQNQARWLVYVYRFQPVVAALSAAGITTVPLKGAVLQAQLYHDSGLRGMGDIDLLVRGTDFQAAVQILMGQGLRLHPENGFTGLEVLAGLPVTQWPNELIFELQGVRLELHQHLLSAAHYRQAFPLCIEEVWERTIPGDGTQAGLGTACLSPADVLAHLCLHLAMHGLQAVQSYLDIDLLIRAGLPEATWEAFVRIAAGWELRSAAYHALSFCRAWMDTPVPEEVMARLDPGWLAQRRVRYLLTAQDLLAGRHPLGIRYPTLTKVALVERLPRILPLLLANLQPPPEKRIQYAEHPLAYWKHIWTVIRRGD